MIDTYNYLKKYIGKNDLKGTYFIPLQKFDIENAEQQMEGIKFPSQLKKFYEEIGAGILSCGEKHPEMLRHSLMNEILPPNIAVDYMMGILEHPDDDAYYMSHAAHEMLQPGDLPFFEIADGSSFMIMKVNSDNPNAVWYMGVEKIEDSLEKFIWRLYHESPDYYTKNW